MISGEVTSDREAVIPIQLRAGDGTLLSRHAMIDTGFSDYVALSRRDITARVRVPSRVRYK